MKKLAFAVCVIITSAVRVEAGTDSYHGPLETRAEFVERACTLKIWQGEGEFAYGLTDDELFEFGLSDNQFGLPVDCVANIMAEISVVPVFSPKAKSYDPLVLSEPVPNDFN